MRAWPSHAWSLLGSLPAPRPLPDSLCGVQGAAGEAPEQNVGETGQGHERQRQYSIRQHDVSFDGA
jgi:hypothetical protein